MDEDIKIVEEKIKALNLHIDNYYKNDCETSVCKELVKERNALENLLSRLKTAERMNDVLADNLIECGIFVNSTVEDVKEWARKKVEDENKINQ